MISSIYSPQAALERVSDISGAGHNMLHNRGDTCDLLFNVIIICKTKDSHFQYENYFLIFFN